MRPVEEITVIHHVCNEAKLSRMYGIGGRELAHAGAEEDGLAGIGVAHFIECEHAKELVKIDNFFEQHIGDEIVHRHLSGIDRVR